MPLSIAKKTKFFFILFALLSLTTFNLNLSNFNMPFFQFKEVYFHIAYFSENNKFVYLNNNFEMINSNKYLKDSQLVKVTSYNGMVSFKNLFQELVKFENILLKTKEVQMIAPKRWNLLLNNGVLVKLGYEDKYKQFQILENIIKDKKNFIIDLRNINKIYITHNND